MATKGKGGKTKAKARTKNRKQSCGVCNKAGHNSRRCPTRSAPASVTVEADYDTSFLFDDDDF